MEELLRLWIVLGCGMFGCVARLGNCGIQHVYLPHLLPPLPSIQGELPATGDMKGECPLSWASGKLII